MIQFSQFRIRATKIARKHYISMTFVTEKLIEFVEPDRKKAELFAREIKTFSPDTKVIEMISSNQHLDTKGHSLCPCKALYLVDDNYYNQIVGNEREEQISMF
jgi:hypothetical protein